LEGDRPLGDYRSGTDREAIQWEEEAINLLLDPLLPIVAEEAPIHRAGPSRSPSMHPVCGHRLAASSNHALASSGGSAITPTAQRLTVSG